MHDPLIDNRVVAFLKHQIDAEGVGHTGRTLYDHLMGTYDLLDRWGNRSDVCLAGLYHSIYGTYHFRHKSFPISQRKTIQNVIGERSERLVYLFCVTKRPEAFFRAFESTANDATGTAALYDYHVQSTIQIATGMLTDLLEIESANLIEQGGRILPAVKRLLTAPISSGAQATLQQFVLEQESEVAAD